MTLSSGGKDSSLSFFYHSTSPTLQLMHLFSKNHFFSSIELKMSSKSTWSGSYDNSRLIFWRQMWSSAITLCPGILREDLSSSSGERGENMRRGDGVELHIRRRFTTWRRLNTVSPHLLAVLLFHGSIRGKCSSRFGSWIKIFGELSLFRFRNSRCEGDLMCQFLSSTVKERQVWIEPFLSQTSSPSCYSSSSSCTIFSQKDISLFCLFYNKPVFV